jgi:hypothetical protein
MEINMEIPNELSMEKELVIYGDCHVVFTAILKPKVLSMAFIMDFPRTLE